MDNKLISFENNEFGSIRTVMINNEPFFIGKDVAVILGYSNPRDALAKHVDDEDKGVAKCDTLGGIQELTVINESGLYSLILSSKLPAAKRFKRWVTSEVLPSIRRSGSYTIPADYSAALRELATAVDRNNALTLENERMKPKELFADAVSASETSILVGQLAKLISQNGYPIGQNRLFEWMRANGYLITNGIRYNTPTQKAMDMKLFELKERTITNPDGSVRTTLTTKVTGRGQVYFVNKFLKNVNSKTDLRKETT